MTSSSTAEGASASVHQLVLEAPRADWHLHKKNGAPSLAHLASSPAWSRPWKAKAGRGPPERLRGSKVGGKGEHLSMPMCSCRQKCHLHSSHQRKDAQLSKLPHHSPRPLASRISNPFRTISAVAQTNLPRSSSPAIPKFPANHSLQSSHAFSSVRCTPFDGSESGAASPSGRRAGG